MDWSGQQKAVNAGLVAFTDGIKLGGDVLPREDEVDNDRMSV